MSSSNLIRLSGLAAVLGGVLFLVVELLSFATETAHLTENLSEWATTTPWLFTWSLFLLGGALLAVISVPLSGIVLDVAVAWLGLILFTGRGETALQPSRVN